MTVQLHNSRRSNVNIAHRSSAMLAQYISFSILISEIYLKTKFSKTRIYSALIRSVEHNDVCHLSAKLIKSSQIETEPFDLLSTKPSSYIKNL